MPAATRTTTMTAGRPARTLSPRRPQPFIRPPSECPPETTPRSPGRPGRPKLRLGHDVAAGKGAREQAVVVGEAARTGDGGVRLVGRLRQGCVGAAVFIPSPDLRPNRFLRHPSRSAAG